MFVTTQTWASVPNTASCAELYSVAGYLYFPGLQLMRLDYASDYMKEPCCCIKLHTTSITNLDSQLILDSLR
jgi:hypothetical protein